MYVTFKYTPAFYFIGDDMVKEAIGTFRTPMRGRTGIIYVPADLVIDSTFPFKEGESVKIRIDNGRLIVEEIKK